MSDKTEITCFLETITNELEEGRPVYIKDELARVKGASHILRVIESQYNGEWDD